MIFSFTIRESLIIAIVLVIIALGITLLTYKFSKKEPKVVQSKCKCLTPEQVLDINARYEMFVDSLYICKKDKRERITDSIVKYHKILHPTK